MRREITELIGSQEATFLHVIDSRDEARERENFLYQLRNLYTQLTDRVPTPNIARFVGNNLNFILITEGTNLVATATVVFVETAVLIKACVEDVVVHHNYRKLHLGKVLLDEAIQLARLRRCKYLQLTSKPARPGTSCFYTKAGFELVAIAREGHPEGTNLYRLYL